MIKHLYASIRCTFLFLIFICFSLQPTIAQKGKKNKKEEAQPTTTITTPKSEKPTPPKKDKNAIKSIEEATKKCIVYEGLFNIYQDTTNGNIFMHVREDQLEKEFIHFHQVIDGAVSAGFFRGGYRGARIFTFQKYFDKIEVVIENTSYYFDENNALSKAADANINKPTIFSSKIAGINKAGDEFLISANGLFLKETFRQVKRSPRPGVGNRFGLGKLSKDKNKILAIRNYPQNSDLLIELVYEDFYPKSSGRADVTDPRIVSVKLAHSVIEMPDNDYQPRYDDPRVGYFMTQVNDMTTVEANNYRDMIHRWDLRKKDPSAVVSEPVEPIVWWIENTTPKDLRPMIREGVESWNIAFEAAGFKNAVVVKEQPDDAEWDAGDIRYNVLRWTSSPFPPFGGYGPSFVNPRTGQILGADIMLEFVYITSRLAQDKLFDRAALDIDYMYEDPAYLEDADHSFCQSGLHLHQSTQFGQHALDAFGADEMEKKALLEESVVRLILHEVGHTLGLNHNFKASMLHSATDAHNKKLTTEEGLTGSVMEYPAINIAPEGDTQGHYYDVKPGPYDMWAIDFGYSSVHADATKETERLEALLARSTEHELLFGNDADDMRRPGKGIDPRAMIGDLSSEPLPYSKDRMELVKSIMPKIMEKYIEEGKSYQELRNAYFRLTGEYGTALRVISRQIGGVYVDRSMAGQDETLRPFTPVDAGTQKAAMVLLAEYAFAPDAFAFPSELYMYLAKQRRGFNHGSSPEDPRIHDRYLNIHKDLLNQLLHPNVMERISDSQIYGNQYHLANLMEDLTSAIFDADKNGSVNSIRQNLQIEYVNRLIGAVAPKSKYDHMAQSAALYELNKIFEMNEKASSSNASTKAHRGHIVFKINQALDLD
ncbi:MAG: zinc-dependent metalloprotease [Bacteroidota bacterium]